jgi:hypothetical protein
MKRVALALLLGGLGLGLGGCGQADSRVIVLHTGRLLGNVYPEDMKGAPPLQHYSYLAGYIAATRREAEETGAQLVLLDSGDSLSGSFASHVTQSANVAALFSDLGYDAVCLGNLDAYLSAEAVKGISSPVLCPFAGADGRPAMPGTAFSVDLKKGPLTVRVVSNFYGDMSPAAQPQRFPMWFGPAGAGVTPFRDYARLLQGPGPRPDLTLFNWMKFEPDQPGVADYVGQLKQWGVDLVTAHRIYSVPGPESWGQSNTSGWPVPVSENILRRNMGFTVARTDLERDSSGWKVVSQKLVQLTANTAAPDTAVIKDINRFAPQIIAADEVLGALEAPLLEGRIRELYMTALATVPGIDAVFYSGASVRSDWSKGILTASKLFDSLPWTDGLAMVTLSPEEQAGLAKIPDMVMLGRTGRKASAPLRLVTSQYFARLIETELGLAPDRVQILPGPSEFDFFKGWLKTHPGFVSMELPSGWSYAAKP